MTVFVNGTIILSFKENMTWQDSNGRFKYRKEFKINKKKLEQCRLKLWGHKNLFGKILWGQ